MDGFFQALTAIGREMQLFLETAFSMGSLYGFFTGIIFTLLTVFFIASKTHTKLPSFIRKEPSEVFKSFHKPNAKGIYKEDSYFQFKKMYLRLKILFYITLISFFTMLTSLFLG